MSSQVIQRMFGRSPAVRIAPGEQSTVTTIITNDAARISLKMLNASGREEVVTLRLKALGREYAGSNALGRAKLAGEIVQTRLKDLFPQLRVDLIGQNSIHGDSFHHGNVPYEVRLRIAGKSSSSEMAALIGEEVEALYTNGPAGGGGVRKYVHEVVGIVSTLIARDHVSQYVNIQSS